MYGNLPGAMHDQHELFGPNMHLESATLACIMASHMCDNLDCLGGCTRHILIRYQEVEKR